MAATWTRWPRVTVLLRADSGFARDEVMACCEAIAVDDVFSLARNQCLVDAVAPELAEAESLALSGPARSFADFAWRTLDSWSRTRRVVAKAKHLPQAVVRALRLYAARRGWGRSERGGSAD
jgi:hypothetical protein